MPHNLAASSTLIGVSDFFDLAMAVTILLFGLSSVATLATVAGVFVDVPVILPVCRVCSRSKKSFQQQVNLK